MRRPVADTSTDLLDGAGQAGKLTQDAMPRWVRASSSPARCAVPSISVVRFLAFEEAHMLKAAA